VIRSLKIPISNLYVKGDYTARIYVGESKKPLNLILDTGSSTFAVNSSLFSADSKLISTSLAQHILYGGGQWFGPVIKEAISMGHRDDLLTLEDVHIALAHDHHTNVFGNADGILGLAYCSLNKAHNLESFLIKNGIQPATTFPWLKLQGVSGSSVEANFNDFPVSHISPYFTQLEQQKLTANKFAFVVHRSSTLQIDATKSNQTKADHPLNQGIFVLGNPESQKGLHNQDFVDVKVIHDKYYNINIKSVFVEGCEKIIFPSLQQQYLDAYVSNGIIDTGASALVFPKPVFEQIKSQLVSFNPNFKQSLAAFSEFTGKEIGIDMQQVELTQWPNILIEIQGLDNKIETLTLTPPTYWQTHAPEPKKISFKITTLPGWPNQGILGLPLMNNYYTVFDRSFVQGQDQDHQGIVRFANKSFAPHLLPDSVHQNIDAMQSHFEQNGHTLHAK